MDQDLSRAGFQPRFLYQVELMLRVIERGDVGRRRGFAAIWKNFEIWMSEYLGGAIDFRVADWTLHPSLREYPKEKGYLRSITGYTLVIVDKSIILEFLFLVMFMNIGKILENAQLKKKASTRQIKRISLLGPQ